jgi:hypothetical protein
MSRCSVSAKSKDTVGRGAGGHHGQIPGPGDPFDRGCKGGDCLSCYPEDLVSSSDGHDFPSGFHGDPCQRTFSLRDLIGRVLSGIH